MQLFPPTIIIPTLLIIATYVFDTYTNKSYLNTLYFNSSILRSLIWIPIVISFSTFLHSLFNRFAALNSLLRFFIAFTIINLNCYPSFLNLFPVLLS